MIVLLEQVGKSLQANSLKALTTSLPGDISNDVEKLTRFLLLLAILDQQAESPSAHFTAINIYKAFGDDLFNKPQNVLCRLDRLVSLKEEYKISPAIGRVLPRFGWMVLRVGAFLIYEMTLNHKRLSTTLGQLSSSKEALHLLQSNPVLEAVLRDKARRLFISWVGHPALGLDISQGKWSPSKFEMPVDGHVGKVFSRTGMVPQVIHEAKQGKGPRWSVIIASQMRPMIQEVVNNFSDDCIMVDHGAFQIGFNCCPDNLVDISCDSCRKFERCEIASLIGCNGHCILKENCKRNWTWRAY